MQRYQSYKPSGVKWLGDVPEHWKIKRIKHLHRVNPSHQRRMNDEDLLFLPMEAVQSDGTFECSRRGPRQSFGASLTEFEVGDVIMAKITPCFENGKGAYLHTMPLSKGIGSTEFHVFRSNHDINPKFTYYILHNQAFRHHAIQFMEGTAGQKRVTTPFIKNLPFALPPLEEQGRIVTFLDQKTADIDSAISKKERLIDLLEEQKAILINKAVTQGLNPGAPRHKTGISWIDTIPSHWHIKRAKYLFREIDERSVNGEEELLSVSHMTGVTPRSEKTNIYMFMAEDYSGSKLCRPNDLVFNIMWAWMGALGVSDRTGIVSPSYGVYRQLKEGTFNNWYLEHLLRSTLYVAEYNKRSTGLHSSRLRLYSHMFFDMELGFPPLEEQDGIERETKKQVSQTDAVITSVRSEIEKLAELRSSLVASVVTGKMRV